MRRFVINLAERPERLAHMTKTFGDIGLSFERFEAIDRATAAHHPDRHRLPPQQGRDWTPGEIACFLSHREIWRMIAEGRARWGAIFEDDIIVDPRLGAVLDEIETRLDDADIVKLETYNQWTLTSRRVVARTDGIEFRRLLAEHKGAAGYVVSRKTARTLVASVERFDRPADFALFAPGHPIGRELKVYQTVPAVIIQDSTQQPGVRNPRLTSSLKSERFALLRTQYSGSSMLKRLARRIAGLHLANITAKRSKIGFAAE